MDLNEFVQHFTKEFEETPAEQFTPSTVYKELEEWDSLIALSIISMVDEKLNKEIRGDDLRRCKTIEELYLVLSAL
jgi:acyl carrier protein